MKKILSTLIFILIGLFCNAQEPGCNDFKEGTFYIPGEKGKPNSLEIIRENNTQMEFSAEEEAKAPEFINLKWIDDCTYIMTYEEADAETDEQKCFINDNNGILVEKIKIEGNCMTYKSTLTTLEGEKISQEGKICKVVTD